MSTPRDRLLIEAADVVCELSADQCQALANEIAEADKPKQIRKVAGLEAPHSVKRLSALWVAEKALDPAELAVALECAALAVKTVSSYEKIELLYTGPNSSGLRRNLQGLLEVIRSAHQTLWIVSFVVVQVDEILKALQERAEADVTVRILIDHHTDQYEWTKGRLQTLAPNCDVFIWPDEHRTINGEAPAALHAKCAVADARQAFVSSANLTGKAMDRNLEVGYLVTGGETPLRLSKHLHDLLVSGMLEPVVSA